MVGRPFEIPLKLHEEVPPGETTYAARVRLDGREIFLFVCPRCGEAGHCVEHDSSLNDHGKLTMRPSLVCGCGGHYWLTQGCWPMSEHSDPERDGWRAGRFGTNAPATERVIPHDGLDRLAYWRARREEERVRRVLAADREEGRARAFLLGSTRAAGA